MWRSFVPSGTEVYGDCWSNPQFLPTDIVSRVRSVVTVLSLPEDVDALPAHAPRGRRVRRATLSALLNGRPGMSAVKVFGVSMDMLVQMHAWRAASRMRSRAQDRRGAVSTYLTGRLRS